VAALGSVYYCCGRCEWRASLLYYMLAPLDGRNFYLLICFFYFIDFWSSFFLLYISDELRIWMAWNNFIEKCKNGIEIKFNFFKNAVIVEVQQYHTHYLYLGPFYANRRQWMLVYQACHLFHFGQHLSCKQTTINISCSFVDISGIVDHHCYNFLFLIVSSVCYFLKQCTMKVKKMSLIIF
jgi:hypothetical protein